MYSEYELFNGISETELKTLLTCIDARVRMFSDGENLNEEGFGTDGDRIGIILDGEVLGVLSSAESQAAPAQCLLKEGETIGSGMGVSEPVTKGQTAILSLSARAIAEPCWFSCNFHYKIWKNLCALQQKRINH